MFRRLFVANRGEVALRIAKACDQLGITPVFGVSESDRSAPYLRGREFVCLGPARSRMSYLDPIRVVQAAKQTRCTALHPGWGFLSENPLFASLCQAHGITFIGPPAHVMHLMGTKTPAKAAMAKAGLSVIPGKIGSLENEEEARDLAEEIGYPILLKAERGGGGRGMRIARNASAVASAFIDAQSEALAAFGDGRLYIEKLIEGGRHVEIQIMADQYGNVVHLGERDCTVQRNHQKLIEESPSPMISDEERARTTAFTVRAVKQIGYVGAGTMEFLLDTDSVLRFMEMNTRLQVEHTVSEMRTGRDLVIEQIHVAAGKPLSFCQEDVVYKGVVIECRINAEDPNDGFRPSPGVISTWLAPETNENVRVDTHVESGYEIPVHYDSLLCKVITRGDTRDEACRTMIDALEQLVCDGVNTTIPMHLSILRSDDFRHNQYDTGTIPGFQK